MAAEGGSCAGMSLGEQKEPWWEGAWGWDRTPRGQGTAWVEAGAGAEGGMGTLAAINSLEAGNGSIIPVPLVSAKTWESH